MDCLDHRSKETHVLDATDTYPMRAALLLGHGGLEALAVRDDVAKPAPSGGEVLIAVGACGMNNTDVNTRTGWYSKTVTAATGQGAAADDVDGSREEA